MTINISQHYKEYTKNLNQNNFIYKAKKAFYLLTGQEERLYRTGFNDGFLYAVKVLQDKKEILDSNKKYVKTSYKTASPELINKIVDAVCMKFHVSKPNIFGKDRHREVVRARSILYNLLHEYCDISISSISRYFGQDHTTVLHSLNNKQNRTRYWGEEQTIWEEYENLKELLSE